MFVVTAYGWEDRGGTRLIVGCEAIALRTIDALQSIGHLGHVTETEEQPARSQEEVARAGRLTRRLAGILFGGEALDE